MTTNTERLAQALREFNESRKDLIADLREVFDANGTETPQVVRDLIEYVDSWLQVTIGKMHDRAALSQHAAEQAVAHDADAVLSVFRDIDSGKVHHASFSHANVVMASKEHYAELSDAPKQAEQQAGPVGECIGYVNPDRVEAAKQWRAGSGTQPPYVYLHPHQTRDQTLAVYTHPATSQERDKVDAERYRAIREPGTDYPTLVVKYAGDELDAAIDAEISARAAGKNEP